MEKEKSVSYLFKEKGLLYKLFVKLKKRIDVRRHKVYS